MELDPSKVLNDSDFEEVFAVQVGGLNSYAVRVKRYLTKILNYYQISCGNIAPYEDDIEGAYSFLAKLCSRMQSIKIHFGLINLVC